MDRNFNNMTIPELVSVLRAAFRMEDFDRVEEVLLTRDTRLNAEIEELRAKVQMDSLSRLYAEEELRKKEVIYEKLKESHEKLLKEVKTSGMAEIDLLRKKSSELECEVNHLRKLKVKIEDQPHGNIIEELKKKNLELVCEVYNLRELSEKSQNGGSALAELRTGVQALEDDKKGLEIKNAELVATVAELRTEKSRLVNEKRQLEIKAECLRAMFDELDGRVTRCEQDTKHLKDVDCVNNEEKPVIDTGVFPFQDKDWEDVGDCVVGIDNAKPSRKNEDTRHSLEAAGTAQPSNKGSKDAHHASSGKGRLELNNGIELIDLEDDDGDDDVSRSRKKPRQTRIEL